MHFDGLFRSTKLERDLLVEVTPDQQGQDLALPWRQAGKSPGYLALTCASMPLGSILVQSHIDGRKKILFVDGLGKEINRPGLHRSNASRNVTLAGKEDDRPHAIGFSQRTLELGAAHLGLCYIQDGASRHRRIMVA